VGASGQFTYLQDSLLYLVYKDIVTTHLNVNKPDKKLSIYQVEFTSNNERFSKIFNEMVVGETIRYYTELRSKRSLETLRILESRVEQLKGSVGQAIDSRANVQDINLNPAFARAQAPIQRSQLNITAYGAAYTELFKNLELARYQYLKEIPLLQVIESPHYPLEYKKPGRLKSGIIGAFIAGTITALVLAFMMFGNQKKLEQLTQV
jgi:capsule polysaccharide export protein KpsE/RkpR